MIVGAGLAGAATAWRLAERGVDVVVLERDEPAGARGSSHGSARIFRYAYPDPFYARLVVEARADWHELEAAAGRVLVRSSGALDFGAHRRPAELAGVLQAAGVAHRLLPREVATERWPGIRFDTDVLWHPAGGVLDPWTAVTAMLELAGSAGAEVRTGREVSRLLATPGGVDVICADGSRVAARHVVVGAGGWLPDLLATPALEPLAARMPPLDVKQEQAYHFPYADPDDAWDWPTFIHQTPQITTYGLPGGRDAGFGGQKVAEYNGGPSIGSARHSSGVVDPENRSRMSAYARTTLPGLVPDPFAETTCLFTNTPTEDFVVDGDDRVTLLSPCSGHGAKFAPLIGRLAADVVLGLRPPPDRFRLAPAAR